MTTAPRMPRRVCLVAHFAYGAISGASGHIGGVERQTSLMAKWLAARGHDVTLLTWDEGQDDEVTIDGVRVLKMCAAGAGLPGVRFLHPRWTSLVRALARADADVYYQNCGEYVTGQVALWCARARRRFVYSVASDADCDPRLPIMHTLRERVLYRYGLRRADEVIVQTRAQQSMLMNGFGRSSTVIPMPCPDTAPDPLPVMTAADGRFGHVLWLGRICRVKRPDRLLDVAEQAPDLHFHVVGPVEDGDYGASIVQRAGLMRNVTVHGPAPREAIPAFFRKVAVLCCTSDVEGFPNTFLEAWSHGVPVVSTLDPDGIIDEHGLGGAAGPDSLAPALGRYAQCTSEWLDTSSRARAYYASRHTVEAVMLQFERMLVHGSGPEPGRRREREAA